MPFSARTIIFVSGLVLFIVVFELVRKRRFREELSVIWLVFSVVIASGSVIDLAFDPLSKSLGIEYPPALAFVMISLVFIIALLYFSLVTSDLKSKLKELTQYVALIEHEMKRLEKLSSPAKE